MFKKFFLMVLCSGLLCAAPAYGWGPIGHRITADIAAANINGITRAKIEQILGDETLAEGSTWPDEQRSNPGDFWQKTASPWHYITISPDTPIAQLVHPPEGDALTALAHFSAILRDDNASLPDKALALRFVVHIVSDLHQPLHAGKSGDRGGNEFIVTWFDAPSNLHYVWDEGMILRQQLSFSEYSERLQRRTTPAQRIAWWEANPEQWASESATLRDRIYPATGPELGMGTADAPVRLQYRYLWDWKPAMELRLAQSGIRLAAYLDQVFADGGDGSGE